jgi:hypothetical protein
MSELMTLLERFVSAVERIAAAMDRSNPQYTWTTGQVVPNTIPASPSPFKPYVGDPPGWLGGGTTCGPTVKCVAMNQADGMGDDSGQRGD